MVRTSAEERREDVIRAAVAEFADKGYYGTSTEAIARRVGVSQPYLFRLFPGKKAIFVAASLRSMEDTRRALEEAVQGLEGQEVLRAMANTYARLITEQPERLRMQMHTYLTVPAVEAEGDHGFGQAVRASWLKLWETVHVLSGADMDDTCAFMAHGMLINTLTTLGFPPDHRIWQGICPSAEFTRRLEK